MFDYNKLFKRDKNLINQKAKQTVSQISEIDWNPVHSWGGFILGRNKYTTTGEEKIDCMRITVGKMLDVVLGVSECFYFVSEIFTSEHLKIRNSPGAGWWKKICYFEEKGR